MREGQYGPANFAVIQVSDFSAPALPQDFDIYKGIATVLQAVHAEQNPGGGSGNVARDANTGDRRNGPGGGGRANSGNGPDNGGGLRQGRGQAGPGAPADPQANAGGPGNGLGNSRGPSGGPGGGGGPMSSDERVYAIDQAVKLTADQKARIKAIYDANEKKAADLRAAQDPDMRDKLRALRADQNTQIEAALKPPQKPAFEAYIASSEPQGRGNGGAGGSGGAIAAATGRPSVDGSRINRQSGPGNVQGPRPDGTPRVTADAGPGDRQGRGQGAQFGGRPGGGQGGDDAYNPLSWIELRMAEGVPIGQAMLGTKLVAFNAISGLPVGPVPPANLPQGRGLPPSLRQKLKTLHRFWDSSQTPGVYFEFLSGIVLWTMILSGLIMYFRLLGTRARQGRSSLFWIKGGGGWWRSLHRLISVVAALFLLWMSFTGTWIGFESSAGPVKRLFAPKPVVFARTAAQAAASVLQGQQPQGQPVNGGQQAQAQAPGQPGTRPGGPGGGGPRGGGLRNPLDFILPLRDLEVRQMTAVTMNSMQQLYPALPIKVVRLRTYGQTKQGVVITGGDETNQYVFNADTGQPASLSEQGYPEGGFPFGTQVHENIKHLHSGAYFGIPARLMNLFAGFCLTFLSISGLVMYFDMWRKRRNTGKKGLFWA
jgi:uncharacterized iron-regulated membrane protein